jgi:Family of unknown function (DUF6152)
MRGLFRASLAAGVLAFAGGQAGAHHAMTIFELFASTIEGTVQEYRFVNPHTILVLKTDGANGSTTVWHLEGDPPAMLARDGFSRDTFQPGDRLKLQVHKLRSGQSGGFWSIRMVLTRNGQEFVGHQCMNSPDRCEPP